MYVKVAYDNFIINEDMMMDGLIDRLVPVISSWLYGTLTLTLFLVFSFCSELQWSSFAYFSVNQHQLMLVELRPG